ncbi:DUF4340 domain-containing protein [Cryomorpha ignava]|uniref:DUF4340 domain-containing protein n=1 Tax=Cryomorpha ignava TaxID=101383 RepID=A0A7K3WRM2_9FLAO|nr:DUF4340 domain-containing protein [Cryomorpha ignava]NEN24323.1 DUF4340 domain-containing protein [Cryomorpha ignava]
MKKLLPLLILVAIAIALAYYFTTSVNVKGTSVESQTSFAISDTASIGKIFIADRAGNTATLSRDGSGWFVNGKYPAREDAVATLLKTFKNVYIQRPVPKDAQEQVNRVMAGASNKVEIYDRKEKWIKTWYVGHATMDKKGTYMLLESPNGGRSTAPFIMDLRGFIGMLNTRFFTNENEWRSVGILRYPDMNLQEIEVFYPNDPSSSFKIDYNGGNDISLFQFPENEAVQNFDTAIVKDYMLNFKLASFENYKTGLSEAAEDSIANSTPFQIIKVKDANQEREIKLWVKAPREGKYEADDVTPEIVDRERVYATCNDGEMALAQRYVWNKFSAPIQVFIKKPNV